LSASLEKVNVEYRKFRERLTANPEPSVMKIMKVQRLDTVRLKRKLWRWYSPDHKPNIGAAKVEVVRKSVAPNGLVSSILTGSTFLGSTFAPIVKWI
jgi:hypothetical protein